MKFNNSRKTHLKKTDICLLSAAYDMACGGEPFVVCNTKCIVQKVRYFRLHAVL